jgi:putative membrane protein
MPEKALAVVCVDRDNDFGRKAGIEGPIIGRKDNLRAAVKLALADPEDSDANCLFMAIQRYDELKEKYTQLEIITLVGSKKFGFESDIKINEQLDAFLETFKAEAFVLVTDGAEDDQITPILQSRAPIISKSTVIIKQAREVESTFYTIKEALRDPFLARLAFGVPGIVILLYLLLPTIGLQLVGGFFGLYLIFKGFGLEDRVFSVFKEMASSISAQRISFPFYVGSIMFAAFGVFSAAPHITDAYALFQVGDYLTGIESTAVSVDFLLMFGTITGLSFLFGKGADAVQLKKAYLLHTYPLSAVAVILGAILLGTAKGVLIGTTTLNFFLALLVISFLFFFGVYKVTAVFDIRKKVTKLLIGIPVYSKTGKWLGRVEKISKEKGLVEFTFKAKKVQVGIEDYNLQNGKILIKGRLSALTNPTKN